MYQGEGRALERRNDNRPGAAIPEVMMQLIPLSPAADTRGDADVQGKLVCALGQIRTADLRFRNSRLAEKLAESKSDRGIFATLSRQVLAHC